ncbi:hypothetical protein FEM48_Zijuj07G0060900 [Ziziphus jujuba var. spinosa]|uniref:Uncharacterized protein n=1 Tax=Ziziphus jujuba var. spinosa TaxID=714518 RepID=A0A978V2X0_ZIZJJ|nr:hypothetical protein FEM48_Zijuj07G0060900 [Ziziphus jujuba var. spinosa]
MVNTPTANTVAAAEHGIALLAAMVRNVAQADASVKAGIFFSSLEFAGILQELANYLNAHIPNVQLIASAIGVVLVVIDNVPLVAVTMGMYDLTSLPIDYEFWQLIAFYAGIGGSMLVNGSAAGVAYMGMEKVDFFWYLWKVMLLVLLPIRQFIASSFPYQQL